MAQSCLPCARWGAGCFPGEARFVLPAARCGCWLISLTVKQRRRKREGLAQRTELESPGTASFSCHVLFYKVRCVTGTFQRGGQRDW